MEPPAGLTVGELFEGLCRDTSKEFEALVQKCSHPGGTTLFSKGEPCRGIFWVLSGLVSVSVSSDSGSSMILYMARPGELLGLKEALCAEAYGTTARTEGPCEVNFVNRADFSTFFSSHPDAAFRIVQQLSERMGVALHQLRSASSINGAKRPN
jgi:CRP/FNR family transcriptional regulator, dissimilatory nitrate respiration regulator